MANWTVLTPIPLIMNEVLNKIQVMYPKANFKFDPTLTYEESIRGVRSVRSAFDITKQSVFPLFTFNMGVLKPFEMVRFQPAIQKDIPNLAASQFKTRYCSFEVNWRWYTTDIVASKTFEVMFLAQAAINDIKNVTLSWQEVGTFDYQVIWPFEGLTSAGYNKQDNLYNFVDGVVQITGEFICMSDVSAKLIGEIDFRLRDFVNRTHVIEQAQITPTVTVWS
ncbi:MAG: hypothetical protein WC511_02495 [Candidatus Pacearchaeota archaeon]